MSIDRSLKLKSALTRHRNVLSRDERIKMLKEQEKWVEGGSVFGLPKVAHRKSHAGKKEKTEAAATAEAAAATGIAAAGTAPGVPTGMAVKGAGAKAATGAPAKAAGGAAGKAAKPEAGAKAAKPGKKEG